MARQDEPERCRRVEAAAQSMVIVVKDQQRDCARRWASFLSSKPSLAKVTPAAGLHIDASIEHKDSATRSKEKHRRVSETQARRKTALFNQNEHFFVV